MFGLNKYIAVGASLVAVGAFTYVKALEARNETLTAEKAVLATDLATCKARTANIIEDGVSDAEIDNIPDADLNDIPDRWLLPAPP